MSNILIQNNTYGYQNFIEKREKGMAMIRYMRSKYDVDEIFDMIHSKLIQCSTDEELNKVFRLIEKYYIE